MKYRLEYDAARDGPPRWEVYGDFGTRKEAQQSERTVRGRYGQTIRTRITPVADDAPAPGPRPPE